MITRDVLVRLSITVATLAAVTFPAFAKQGVTVDVPNWGKTREKTLCLLVTPDKEIKTRCSVSRKDGDLTSYVDFDGETYSITRDYEIPDVAEFALVIEDGEDKVIGKVRAKGECWVGKKVTFCAK